MVRLTRIYTRGGDKGRTALGDGSRVAKDDLRVAALGAVDEANAAVGLARIHTGELADGATVDAMLARIQNDLFDLGADLATPLSDSLPYEPLRVVPEQVQRLEQEADALNADLPDLTSFVLPGGNATAAHLHSARTIARRAERVVAELAEVADLHSTALAYINRLSDHLFVLARHAAQQAGGDVLWVPGKNR